MELSTILHRLRKLARPEQLAGMARYGMDTRKRLGVAIPEMRKLARTIGRDHALALALWKTGWLEARILAAYIDELEKVTSRQMDQWVREFSSWDVCDQVCMNLFDRTPHTEKKVRQWAASKEEFTRRAAFALLASMAWHWKSKPDAFFFQFLPLIKHAAVDDRHLVKKAVSWALRQIGKRSGAKRRAEILQFTVELLMLEHPAARWIARDTQRDLAKVTG